MTKPKPKKLTPQQESFARWVVRGDPLPEGFYVYGLADPIDGAVFYIGKGRGKRIFDHERDARRHRERGNVRKNARLLEITDSHGEPLRLCFADGLTETAAYDLERRLIVRHADSITNHQGGRLHRLQRAYLINTLTIRQFLPAPPADPRRRELWYEIGTELRENQVRLEYAMDREGVPVP